LVIGTVICTVAAVVSSLFFQDVYEATACLALRREPEAEPIAISGRAARAWKDSLKGAVVLQAMLGDLRSAWEEVQSPRRTDEETGAAQTRSEDESGQAAALLSVLDTADTRTLREMSREKLAAITEARLIDALRSDISSTIGAGFREPSMYIIELSAHSSDGAEARLIANAWAQAFKRYYEQKVDEFYDIPFQAVTAQFDQATNRYEQAEATYSAAVGDLGLRTRQHRIDAKGQSLAELLARRSEQIAELFRLEAQAGVSGSSGSNDNGSLEQSVDESSKAVRVARRTVARLDEEIAGVEEEIHELETGLVDERARIASLEFKLEQAKAVYAAALERVAGATLARQTRRAPISLVAGATAPVEKVFPRWWQIILYGILVGLLASAGVGVMIDRLAGRRPRHS